MRLFWWFLLLGVILYFAEMLFLYLFQEKLIFRSDLAPKDVTLPPNAKRLFVDGIEVGVIDKGSDVTLFYFGGNANNALEILNFLETLPYNSVTFNYPSYGNSTGKPSQETLFKIAQKLFNRFKTSKNILIGRSLGTGVASYLAYKNQPQGVILITPFYSLTHIAQLNYPFYPVKKLLRNPFPNYYYLSHYHNPLYIILAQHDSTTPPQTTNRLIEEVKPKKVVQISQAEHGNILEFQETQEVLKEFIEEIVKGGKASSS